MLKKVYKEASAVIGRITSDDIFMYAAQGSFYIITASIPFMMLFLALLKFIIPITEAEVIVLAKSIVPGMLEKTVETVIKEIYFKSGAIISITGITALWSSSRGVAAVERGIKKVYRIRNRRRVFKNIAFSVIYTLIFIGVLLGTLLIMVFGKNLYNFVSGYLEWIVRLEEILGGVDEIVFFAGFAAFFAIMYRIFAGRGARLREQLPGAVFSAGGWFLMSFLFSVYVENFANYSYVYGSLTVIVLMMLWLYICMIIILLGAELNMFIKEKKKNKLNAGKGQNGE